MAARSLGVLTDAELGGRRVRGGNQRHLLLVGDVPRPIIAEVSERGAAVRLAADLSAAFVALAEEDFDAVAVDPLTDGCGVDLVTALKEDDAAHEHTLATLYGARGGAPFLRGVRVPSAEGLAVLRLRYARTPFVVLPSDGGWRYGLVIVPPHASVIRDARKIPIVTTLLTVHPESLGQPRGGLA